MRAMTRAAERVLALALAEVGYLEKASNAQLDSPTANAGSGNYTKYARDLDAVEGFFNGRKQGAAWCAVFAIWPFVRAFGAELAMRMLYLPAKSLGAGVKYLAQYFQRAGRFFTAGPEPGDLIFFYKRDLTSWAHVGLVERTDGERVYTVEGNASGASGVTPNGGGVVRKSYALTYERIAGYGRPDWPAAEEADGASDYAKTSTEKAKEAGIIQGDTNGGYRWHDPITREELAVVLDRLGLLG